MKRNLKKILKNIWEKGRNIKYPFKRDNIA